MGLKIDDLIKETIQVATLPEIFYQINEAVDDPECSFTEVGEIIVRDAGLTARLLKIVNSSFFGFPSKIETISHAITIIGMAQLRDLILVTKVINQFKGLGYSELNMTNFWAHNISSGLAARIIAVYCREQNAERYYVMGLLHDIGRLVFLMNLPEETYKGILNLNEKQLLFQAEKEVLGLDHAEVGGALLRAWNLPERLVEGVTNHHNPVNGSKPTKEAAIIHLADIIIHCIELGYSGEPHVPPLNHKAWETLGLPSSLLPSIVDQIDRQYEEVIQVFLSEE